MKPEIKAEWLEELTKHKQAKETLRNYNGMCCLGVLCEVASRHDIGEWINHDTDAGADCDFSFHTEGDEEHLILPTEVRDWAELDGFSGHLPFHDKQLQPVSLAMANDFGCTFAQISDLIRHFL